MDKREIARIRQYLGMSVKEFGLKIGAHFTTVSMMETGKRKPTTAQLNRLLQMREKAQREVQKWIL